MGEKLLHDVVSATGLPQDLISQELLRLLRKSGATPATITLEDLRQILADYVQDVLLEAKLESSGPVEESK